MTSTPGNSEAVGCAGYGVGTGGSVGGGSVLRNETPHQYAEEAPLRPESTPRPISITPALNGWIVQIGCKTLVFNNLQQLLDEMRNYYTNPKETATRFLSSKTNNV